MSCSLIKYERVNVAAGTARVVSVIILLLDFSTPKTDSLR